MVRSAAAWSALVVAAAVSTGVACKSQADAGSVERLPSTAAAPVAMAPGSAGVSAPTGTAGKVRVVEAPESGTVESIVQSTLDASRAEGRTLVVYVGATWCEPCQYFHRAAERGDLDATFPRMTLLAFDLDRDRDRLTAAGYVSKYIPLFALPGADGAASGKQIEGGIKGDGAVAFITPRLQALLLE